MTAEASWVEAMPEVYDRCLGPALFGPFANYLAGTVAAAAPADVFEVAAGTGILTRALVRALPAARITATDLNPAMVAWAAERIPGARWAQADAQAIPERDASADLVVCQFGAMFFPDKPAAYAEMARILRPDGTVRLLVWDRIELSAFPRALADSLRTVLPADPPDFLARVPHGYHAVARIEADLRAGGLVDVVIAPVLRRGEASSAAALAEGFCTGTPLRFALEQRGDLGAITDAVARDMTERLGPGPVAGDLAALDVTARRG
jgi:SAM-dependent methyltransferase